ncbi:aldehyde dehydrogenase family protein [Nocardia aurantia]|uniref:NAD/NADP-dependent betaine aldehyde dehydrogenase n=1 Tax=Nocardia aurantia TaxID=2585199 RepID=A0A7K0DIR1_9NOCA|nr:aldehyde dehydrogenase family protein [Nocardia aurantia]MQY25706.1 NAD/NADP-dependent betaine aldehyde dehydrogenase [Nocardia aurantia]
MPTNAALDRQSLPFLTGDPKRLLIGGEWVESASGRTFPSIDPSTGATIAEIAQADPDDVNRAVAAARAAFEGPWRSLTPAARQSIIWQVADVIEANAAELRRLEAVDMGMPIGRDPGAGADKLVEVLRYFAGFATKIHGRTLPNSMPWQILTYTSHEPVGVVASIIPWNSPINNVLWKLAPVLASGCTMVLKPAEEASLVALRIGELLSGTDLPDGVVNIVTGFGEAGAALVEHPGVDKVAFTGSTATGQAIVRASAGNLKRLTLELGGKSPDVVFADADFRRAVPGVAMGVFGNSGQACCAGTRIFVERPIFEEFAAALTAYTAKLKVGPSLDPQTRIGPLVSQAQLSRVTGYLDIGREAGARVLAGGARLTDGDLANGYFVPPTLLADVTDDMAVVREEIFGPVGCLLPFDTVEEVAARSNDTEFGLAGGIWTTNLGNAHRLAALMRTGTVWVNTYNLFDPAVPFGGYKMSGWGHENGPDALGQYLTTKAVWVRTD